MSFYGRPYLFAFAKLLLFPVPSKVFSHYFYISIEMSNLSKKKQKKRVYQN